MLSIRRNYVLFLSHGNLKHNRVQVVLLSNSLVADVSLDIFFKKVIKFLKQDIVKWLLPQSGLYS